MIPRFAKQTLSERLEEAPVVALLGSRQVGKTTLARSLDIGKPVHYLDLERPSDVARLQDPELYLSEHKGELVVLDEIQRTPELFAVLRSLVDERRSEGESAGQYLVLGSASPDLLRQSSESLAGRISYLELTPFLLAELPDEATTLNRHWFRGGYPDSWLARSDKSSRQWREDFVKSYVEQYLPELGASASPLELQRFLSMMAHQQGATLNVSKLSSSLDMGAKTVRRYIDYLEGLFLVRSLPPWSRNAGKRLVKSPKVYLRDSGILHALAGFADYNALRGHQLCGASWEGYCIDQILGRLPSGYRATFYRTQAGAEVDLILEAPDGAITAIEIKLTLSPKVTARFLEVMEAIGAERGFYVIPTGQPFPAKERVTVCGIGEFHQAYMA